MFNIPAHVKSKNNSVRLRSKKDVFEVMDGEELAFCSNQAVAVRGVGVDDIPFGPRVLFYLVNFKLCVVDAMASTKSQAQLLF